MNISQTRPGEEDGEFQMYSSENRGDRAESDNGVLRTKIAKIVEELWRKGTASGTIIEKKFILKISIEPEISLGVRPSTSDIASVTDKSNKRKFGECGRAIGADGVEDGDASHGVQRTMSMNDLKPNQVYGYVPAEPGIAGSILQPLRPGIYAITCPWCKELGPWLQKGKDPIKSIHSHITIAHSDLLGREGLVPLKNHHMVALWGTLISDCAELPCESQTKDDYSPPVKRVITESTFMSSTSPRLADEKMKGSLKVRAREQLTTHLKEPREKSRETEEIDLMPGFDPYDSNYLKSDINDGGDQGRKEKRTSTVSQRHHSVPNNHLRGSDEGLQQLTSSSSVASGNQSLDTAMIDRSQTPAQQPPNEGEIPRSPEVSKPQASADSHLPLLHPDIRLRVEAASDIDITMSDEPQQGFQSQHKIECQLNSVPILAAISPSVETSDKPQIPVPEEVTFPAAIQVELDSPPEKVITTTDKHSAFVTSSDDEQYFR